MSKIIIRARRLVLQPSSEWAAIELERSSALRVFVCYFVPLALIAPVANASRVFTGSAGPSSFFVDASATLQFAVLSAISTFVTQTIGVLVVALVVYLVTPLYEGARSFSAAFRLVAYAGTPVWLAGVVLIVPIQQFPIAAVLILIGLMHASYIFYLGLHHVVKVRLREAAECAAIVALISLMLSTALGYIGGAVRLFPHL